MRASPALGIQRGAQLLDLGGLLAQFGRVRGQDIIEAGAGELAEFAAGILGEGLEGGVVHYGIKA